VIRQNPVRKAVRLQSWNLFDFHASLENRESLRPWRSTKACFPKGKVLLQGYQISDDIQENWGMAELGKWIEIDQQTLILRKQADGVGKRNRYHVISDFLHPACNPKETSYPFLLVVLAETELASVVPRLSFQRKARGVSRDPTYVLPARSRELLSRLLRSVGILNAGED
jgi:hypothetical protein